MDKNKNKFLSFLPKALSFQNPPFSPSRDNDVTTPRHRGRGFSGPIVSIIPKEAWSRTKSEMVDTTQEPTSPKVSCLGQIKQRHKKNEKDDAKRSRVPLKKKAAAVKKEEMSFSSGTQSGAAQVAGAKAPALGHMRRFASSRNSLSNFDWTAQVAPEDSDRRRNCHSDEDIDEEEEEVRIPFSAPLSAGGVEMRLQPKKEINLWKRRTMTTTTTPPPLLTLDS